MLLIPGPVDVPESVLKASAYVVNHRSDEFREIVRDCENMLNRFADSAKTVITTGSGTTAVESMILSMTEPGESVIAVSFGEFGDRMIDSLHRRGLNVHTIRKNTDDSLSEGEFEERVSNLENCSSVFFVQNETGNGTSIRNLRSLTRIARDHGLRVFVDSVSAFGAVPIRVNEWGIDALATCSQKGIASVPGLGIVCIGKESSEKISPRNDIPQYMDLGISLKFIEKNETPYTPSTGSFNALRIALGILSVEGIENRWKRIRANAGFLREFLSASGSRVIGNVNNYSDTVIAFMPGSDTTRIIGELAGRGLVVSRGMGEFAGNSIRVGNLGITDGKDIMTFLNSYLEITGSPQRVRPEDIPAESLYSTNTVQ